MEPNIVVDVEEESIGDNPDNDAVNADDMTNRIQLLSDLRKKVVEEGVCRDDVEGMNGMLRGFSEEVVSVESYFYTQDRTRMNITFALEAIDNGIMSMIRRFIATIVRYVKNGYQYLRSLFKNAGVAVDRADDYEKLVLEIRGATIALVDMLNDKASSDRIINSVVSKMTTKANPVYSVTRSSTLETQVTNHLESWIAIAGIVEAAIQAAPTETPELTQVDLNQKDIQVFVDSIKGDLTNQPRELLDMVFGDFPSGRTLYDKLSSLETTTKDLERSLNAKFSSQFFKDLDNADVAGTMDLMHRLSAFIQGLHKAGKDYTQYLIDRCNFRKFVAEFNFEVAKGLYKEIENKELTVLPEATQIMQSVVDKIKKVKK